MSVTTLPTRTDCGHFVQFYDEPDGLADQVADFLETGRREGAGAVLIATEANREAVRRRLEASRKGSDKGSDRAPRKGGALAGPLVVLDARATLERVLLDGEPDEARFRQAMDPVFEQVSDSGRRPVRAFGEMVALLCSDGRHEAALRLERLWNELAGRHAFSLLCAYPMAAFAGADRAATFRAVCAEHGAVWPAQSDPRIPGGHPGLRMALLRQKAVSLEGEVDRRRRAEAALVQRECDLADFLENAAEGIHRVAADGTILWANRAELEMLGYAREEYIGRRIGEFHVDRPAIERIMRKLAAGETLYEEPARLRCRNGEVKHVLIQSNALFEDGKLVYTRCFTRDVSDRVALAEVRHERNSLLMKAPVAAALLTGPAHVFRLANPAWCALMGVADPVGRSWQELAGELPESGIGAALEATYRSGASFVSPEFPVAARRGEEVEGGRYLRLNLEPLRNASGHVYGVMVLADEVSEQVKARRALELAHRERKRLLEEVEAASRAKDEFLAMLGHELRNPLSPIATALQLMKMRGDAATAREQEIIQRQVTHLTRLVDDLLDVSRLTSGKIELHRQPVEVAETVMKAIEMASPLLEQRSHRLTIEVPVSGLAWEVDSVRLAQVVANLLTNAARYTDPGGEIVLKAGREQGRIRLSVRDNGRGIAAEVLPHVFDLFYQGRRTLEKAAGGLGLGLALVRSLVAMHGGTVEAFSDGPGQGSEFVLRLPPSSIGREGNAASSQATVTATARAGPVASARRVLIVDDNEDAARLLGRLLEASGHVSCVVHDPLAALAAADAFAPELALLDIGLPVMDGYELARALRHRHGPRLRLLALTGYGQDADRRRSSEAGFERHLVKPIDHEALLALLRS